MQRSVGDEEPDVAGGHAIAHPLAPARGHPRPASYRDAYAAGDSEDDEDGESGDEDEDANPVRADKVFVVADTFLGSRQNDEEQRANAGRLSTLPGAAAEGPRKTTKELAQERLQLLGVGPPGRGAARGIGPSPIDGDDFDTGADGADVMELAEAGGGSPDRQPEPPAPDDLPPAVVQPVRHERGDTRYSEPPQPNRRAPGAGIVRGGAPRTSSRSPDCTHAGFGGPAAYRQQRPEYMDDNDDDPPAGGNAAHGGAPSRNPLLASVSGPEAHRTQRPAAPRGEGATHVHRLTGVPHPRAHGKAVRQSTGKRPAGERPPHVSESRRHAKSRRVIESGSDADGDDHQGGDAGDGSEREGRYADIHAAAPVEIASDAAAAPQPPAVVSAAPDDGDDTLPARPDSAWGALEASVKSEDLTAMTPAVRMQHTGKLLRRLPKGTVLGEVTRDAKPLAVSADATDGVLPLCCVDDLEDAVRLLDKLAIHLPVPQIKTEVLQRLAVGPKAMVDFGGSMPAARLVVLYGLQLVMKHLVAKRHSIADAASIFVQHAWEVADEIERLGPLTLRGVGSLEVEGQRAELKLVLGAALAMLAKFVEGPVPIGAASMLHNELVVSMLDLRRSHVTRGMREDALFIVTRLAEFARDGADAEHVELTRCLIRQGGPWTALLAVVDAWYAQRRPANADPVLHMGEHRTLVPLTFTPLGILAAVALRHKVLPWSEVEGAVLAWPGLAPSGRAQFWSVANLGCMQLAAELLAATIKAAPELLGTDVPLPLAIRAWTVMVAHRLMDGTSQVKSAVRELTEAMQKPPAQAKVAPLFDGDCTVLHSRDGKAAAPMACAMLDKVRLPGVAPELRSGLVQTGRVLVDIISKSQCAPVFLAHPALLRPDPLRTNARDPLTQEARKGGRHAGSLRSRLCRVAAVQCPQRPAGSPAARSGRPHLRLPDCKGAGTGVQWRGVCPADAPFLPRLGARP